MEGDVGFELRVDPNKDKTALISKNNNEVCNIFSLLLVGKVCACDALILRQKHEQEVNFLELEI